MGRFATREAGGAMIVDFGDDFSRENFIELEREVAELVREGNSSIALDLSALPMISSDGIGLLVPMHDRCEQAGGKLAVFGLNERAVRVVRLASLDGFFNLHADEASALADLAPPPAEEEEPPEEEPPQGTPEQKREERPEETLEQKPEETPEEKREEAPEEKPKEKPEEKPQPEVEKPAPKPRPKRIRSGRMVAAPRSDEHEQRMRDVIHRVVRSRMHALVLERASAKGTASVKKMASDLGVSTASVKAPFEALVAAGVLQPAGGGDYSYSPSGEVKGDVEFFLERWGEPERRSRMAAWLLAEEKTGG